MLHANHTVREAGKRSALHQCSLKRQQKKLAAVPLLFVRQQRGEQHTQIVVSRPYTDALYFGRLGIVVNGRFVGHGKEHIAQMCRAFLAEKRYTLGGFGKLHRVRRRQQMLHFVQLFVNVDEPALFQADTIQKYVRIQAQPPFCSS